VPDPFDLVEAKIDRAGEHIDVLYNEIRDWAKVNPYSVETEPKGQSTHHRLNVRLHRVPDVRRWGLLFGDAVNNLRSSLDHLVYALAIRASGQDPPPDSNRLQFLILDDPSAWQAQSRRRLGPLSDQMRTAIEAVQPYKLGSQNLAHSSVLWWIGELDNAAKHRMIRPVFIAPAGFEAIVRTLTAGPMTVTTPLAPIQDQATILEISGEAVTEVEDEVKVALGIGIEVRGTSVLLHDALDKMFDRTVEISAELRKQSRSKAPPPVEVPRGRVPATAPWRCSRA
jgi:hypothetical protein